MSTVACFHCTCKTHSYVQHFITDGNDAVGGIATQLACADGVSSGFLHIKDFRVSEKIMMQKSVYCYKASHSNLRLFTKIEVLQRNT